jgi:hypothetical protein
MSGNGSFAMLESVDVWCNCGNRYSVTDRGDGNDRWQEHCPNCGEKVELTFAFRVIEAGKPAVAA